MISEEIYEQFKKIVADICFLLEMEITNTDNSKKTVYYTSYDIPVVDINTNVVYQPFAFDIENFSYGSDLSIDNLTVKLDNTKLQQVGIFLNKDQRGNNVKVKLAILNEFGNAIATLEFFSGKISSVEINEKEARITIKHDLLFWNNRTLRIHTYDLFPNQKDLNNTTLMKWGRS